MADAPILKPQPIGGFPEWQPGEKLVEDRFLEVIRRQFRRFGFTPIETPAVERTEVMTAKGVVDKEIYGLSRLAAADDAEAGGDLALHFDLTVPTARYVAQHMNRLVFPFRRYQIQKVWRGERPQAGRFREFYQCDIDIIGNGSLSPLADAEIPVVIHTIFRDLDIGGAVVRINNRKLLQGLVESHGVTAERFAAALRAIDALEKIGRDGVAAALVAEAGMQAGEAERLLATLTAPVASPQDLADAGSGPLFAAGLDELTQVVDGMRALGMPDDGYRLDLSIARGLDYYTGTVYETVLTALPKIGSVCSGGRYDDLASAYTRQKLPGVGISIGLTRLLARLFEAKIVTPAGQTPATTLVTTMDRARLADYLAIAAGLRAAGIDTEVFTEPKKLGDQLKYADRKGFRFAVIAGEDEFAAGTVQVKDLAAQTQESVAAAELATHLNRESK
ncbi:MAG: histidine--tRNA ligase [Rhodospirillaceae bacterium]|nr:histidine--tRNA ligase [Rhodospirillaceae bacterium]